MQISTSRFGTVDVLNENVIKFPEGILGFSELREFVLLDDPNDEIFAWLQSCETPEIAFPVLEPELFVDSYKVSLAKTDLELLNLKTLEGVRYFSIINIPEDPTLMTANLKAPIIINVNDRLAKQCVLQDNQWAIKEMIFSKLQQRMVQAPQKPIKSQTQDWGVAVRLPDNNKQIDAN